MEITKEVRQKIRTAIIANRGNFEGSDAKYAKSFDINPGVFSRISKGDTERVMRDQKWITIARKLNVQLGDAPEWMPANTAVFEFINTQLDICQRDSTCGMYCDQADIGKTFAARYYANTHKNAIYVDCSIYKTKRRLIPYLARQLGLDNNGKYQDVFNDLAYYLNIIQNVIFILDEFGDLQYDAFLECKALWNASEYKSAWYALGADGLKFKIEKGKSAHKVGYAEMFSRLGSKYQKIIPKVPDEAKEFIYDIQLEIINTNLPSGSVNPKELLMKCNGSLRDLRIQILKIKRKQQMQAA